ncbi:glycosyltransferase [Cytobacillus sp. IB215665]|uniref:tetratricopeptide repeat-containing glycosyltransferase family 2 protein n=1 Tax=Cytobacillus sp. IB215665 TaxID=3097357 RepID=UPI002A14DF3B|nr:glycosyltransferase [Cytobacillus sp. IB215665]MDX8366107.1 glycosyltransferase [Cytobacillus sp. IB215665]
MEISLCMIVKNEEEVLDNCLSSIAKLMDEIIIIDTGSSDRTKEIAKMYTDKVYDFEWIDDFSKARNYSFSKATKDYIMWLDADDIVPIDSQRKIAEVKQNLLDLNPDAIMMPYEYNFDKDGRPLLTLYRNRIVKKECKFKWHGYVHEELKVSGKVFKTDIVIKHKRVRPRSERNIKIYEKVLAAQKTLPPRDIFLYANECFDHKNYEKAIELYDTFLTLKNQDKEFRNFAIWRLVDTYINLKQYDKAIEYCLTSFKMGSPRAEICCRLAYCFKENKQITQAISWYKVATKLEMTDLDDNITFFQEPCYTWAPHLELCSCYIFLKDYSKAKFHNDLAAKYTPDSSVVKSNNQFFHDLNM